MSLRCLAVVRRRPLPKPLALRQPREPTAEERERHHLTHAGFAEWCEPCVYGKARGNQHRKQVVERAAAKPELVEFDYTFWTHVGYELTSDEALGAACSLTGKDRKTKTPFATIVLRKGPWQFAASLVSRWKWTISVYKGSIRRQTLADSTGGRRGIGWLVLTTPDSSGA